jgi:LCP family protein required for cell wall assembly
MTDQGRGDHPYGDGRCVGSSSAARQDDGVPVPDGPSAVGHEELRDGELLSEAGVAQSQDPVTVGSLAMGPGDAAGGTAYPAGPASATATRPGYHPADRPGPAAAGAGGGGGGHRRRGVRRAPRFSRRGKVVLWVAAGMVLVLVAGGALVYLKLNANLQSAPLDLGGTQAAEKTDPFGRAAVNILLIGSDTRGNRGDCKLGGDCGSGSNADVEMLVHLSADRSNATIMSIPRDTIVNVPQCTGPGTGTVPHVYPALQSVQITSSLQDGGPGCTVATVHALTGVTIDHFVMIDFSGVVNMADDVGGVPVCVSANVFDPYSHLRLTKGTHVVSGVQALEFLRTRHGFLYGGDLYRTQAQHMYLSALIRKMKSASTLADPVTLYNLANDATRAVTVDPSLDSIPRLIGLASDLNKVPTKRITFVTMPTVPYPANPGNWLSPAMPAAQQLFSDIAGDIPLSRGGPVAPSTAPAAPRATPSPTPSVDKAAVPVSVENGSGLAGRAHDVAAALAAAGFTQSVGDVNTAYTAATSLTYGRGERAQARAVAQALRLPATALHRSGSSLTLVIGTDWPTGTTFPASPTASPSASPSASAGGSPAGGAAVPPPGSLPENASHANECAQVNPSYEF